MSKIYLGCLLVIAFAISFAVPAQAQRVRVGGLSCDADPRVSLVLGSRQDMRCVFRSIDTGAQYFYRGTIRRVGIDIGVTRGGTLFWAVFSRNSRVGRDTLRGNYVGASANAAVGVGLGANLLTGGARRTITLQPLSVDGLIGINLALTVTSLSLR